MIDKRYILPFHYNAWSLSLDEAFQVLTLCLAPLILHLAAGIPEPTILRGVGPSWWDRIHFFNPVSIIWRYMAIADRRTRARDWDKYDLAATNAVFWDGETKKWDASEEMLSKSRAWVTHEPSSSHVALMSASTLVTIGLTIQGVQAAVSIASGGPEAAHAAFSYLALLSLFRLFPAFWMSKDYAFTYQRDNGWGQFLPYHSQWQAVSTMHPRPPARARTFSSIASITKTFSGSRSEMVEVISPIDDESPRLFSTKNWRGILFRIFWVFCLAVIAIYVVYAALQGIAILWDKLAFSTTVVVERAFYCMITVGCLLTHGWYLVKGTNNSTIIPCAHCTWYKIFTIIMIALALGVIVVSFMETHICSDKDGPYYTTFPCDYRGLPYRHTSRGGGSA